MIILTEAEVKSLQELRPGSLDKYLDDPADQAARKARTAEALAGALRDLLPGQRPSFMDIGCGIPYLALAMKRVHGLQAGCCDSATQSERAARLLGLPFSFVALETGVAPRGQAGACALFRVNLLSGQALGKDPCANNSRRAVLSMVLPGGVLFVSPNRGEDVQLTPEFWTFHGRRVSRTMDLRRADGAPCLAMVID
jgi:hypothetical protein